MLALNLLDRDRQAVLASLVFTKVAKLTVIRKKNSLLKGCFCGVFGNMSSF